MYWPISMCWCLYEAPVHDILIQMQRIIHLILASCSFILSVAFITLGM